MHSTQREREILELLTDTGSGRIQDLARRLGVTEETIRRNVRRLEAEGLVKKVHGGVYLKDWTSEPSFNQRFAENPAAKQQIARHPAGMIEDGDSLFLDCESACKTDPPWWVWSAPIVWSSLNVNAWSASGLSASCFLARAGGSAARYAV